MANESFTMDDLRALEGAIALGATRVKYTDKEVEYRSLKDMQATRRMIRRELGLEDSSKRTGLFGGRRIVAKHSKGLDE